jgi:hypothetical protein
VRPLAWTLFVLGVGAASVAFAFALLSVRRVDAGDTEMSPSPAPRAVTPRVTDEPAPIPAPAAVDPPARTATGSRRDDRELHGETDHERRAAGTDPTETRGGHEPGALDEIEKTAVDHLVSGRTLEALASYRDLLARTPDSRAFGVVVRTLTRRAEQRCAAHELPEEACLVVQR